MERIAPEQHDTLDGIPESSENPSLFGHPGTVALLLEAQAANRLPHGLIFAGPAGIGKATLAFHLTRHLLLGGKANPTVFGQVAPDTALFRQVASGAHPSVLHLTRPPTAQGSGFKTVISVEEVRRLGRFLSHTAHDGGYRVVVVDPADDLNTQAANALLKSLEEPPPRTLFILIAHSLGRLLPTLRSRCQTLRLQPLDRDTLFQALGTLLPALPADDAVRAALYQRSGGSVRQAILFTEHGGLNIIQALHGLASAPRFDAGEAHRLADAVAQRGKEAALDIFRSEALELLNRAAAEAAQTGELGHAARLANAWREAQAAEAEAAAFNLDRKQQALSLISRVRTAVAR